MHAIVIPTLKNYSLFAAISQKRASPDQAKRNARVNIMQVLGNVQSSSPIMPAQPSHQSEEEVAVDELARERQAHVVGLVKAFQQETSKPPSPMPRSPRHSPTNRYLSYARSYTNMHLLSGGAVICNYGVAKSIMFYPL